MKTKVLVKILVGVTCIASIVILASFYHSRKQEEQYKQSHRQEVKDHYAAHMKAKQDTVLYRKTKEGWQEAGFLYKDASVGLSTIEEDYYQVKSTDYYVYYDNLKIEETLPEKITSPNLLWDIDIETNVPTILLENGQKKYSLDISIQAPVLKKEEKYYTILLQDKTYQIAKENIEQEIKTKREVSACSKIPVLFFQDEENLEERIKYLKEQNYTFILEKDLLDFVNQKILLPEKTIMIVQKEETEHSKKIMATYQVPIQSFSELIQTYQDRDDLTSITAPNNWYRITNNTSFQRFQDILVGKKEIVDKAEQIPVLNYHFFYDQTTENCNESICLEKKKFEEQLAYLKENNYKTLTMQEFNDWLDRKQDFPKKSVLITVDDGAMGTDTHLPELLQKYDLKATLFLISGWWPQTKYPTGNLEIQSHGHELHHNNYCVNGNCGVKGLLISQEEIEADLNQSIQTIGNPIAFCYPFYAYNDTLVAAVKNTFSLAFVGGNKKASRTGDKYKIPRYIIYKDTNLENFKKIITP